MFTRSFYALFAFVHRYVHVQDIYSCMRVKEIMHTERLFIDQAENEVEST